MVNDELIPIIREKFRQGQRRNEIKENLMQEGYYEEDIEDSISQLQHDTIKQLPGIAWIYRLIEDFETKSTLSTTRMTILLMVVCIVVLFLMAGGLYLVFDPLGTGSQARDAARAADIARVQTALGYYYQQNSTYPASLDKLVPEFLTIVPRDPQSGEVYSYKTVDNGANYDLCVSYELQQQQCVNAAASSSLIPVIPTATPAPAFVPQKAISGAPSPSGTGGIH